MKMKKKDILLILILFFVSLLIRVNGVSNVNLNMDEWIYWVNTNKILASNFAPRADVFDYSGAFMSYIGAIFTLLFGGDLNVLRMISVISGSLTVPFLYLFGSVMYDRKTGLLSALFLSLSAYHSLYSRLYMLEALTLFFITAFLYFFWMSQCSDDRKSTIYAIIAGAMLGLAFDAKYISFFLTPVIFVYVLWIRRFNFKALADKRIILMFIFAFLFFLPVLVSAFYTRVGFHGIYYYAIEKFEKERPSGTRACELSPIDLLTRGGESLLEVLATWNAEPILPWVKLFEFSVILLLLITLFSYLPNFIRREKRSCFLLISLFMLFILLLGLANMRHYLIYSVPFLYVMISHFVVKSFGHMRKENNKKNIFIIFLIFLTVVVLFSFFVTAIISPHLDTGEYDPWVKSAVCYIKIDIIKSCYEKEPVLIGIVSSTKRNVDHELYLSKINIDINTSSLIKLGTAYQKEIISIDCEKINILKPDYIIVSEPFYDDYFKVNVKKEIFEDYRIVFHSKNYPHGCFVFKRKNMELLDLPSTIKGEDRTISRDMVKISVPSGMKVGKVYTGVVKVKNTRDSPTNFTVRVYSDYFTIFVDKEPFNVILDKGSTRIFKFKIVHIREYSGEIAITADLFAKISEDEYYRKVDSFTKYVS